MYIDILDLFLLTLITSIIYYWVCAQRIRELALKGAQQECKKLDLQLLEGSVALKKLRIKRTHSGRLGLIRDYIFEFSATGDERYLGTVTMFGLSVVNIDLQPHRML